MPEYSPPKTIQSKKASMVPKKFQKEAKALRFARADPRDALPREVQVDIGNWDKKVSETIRRARVCL